MIYRIHYLLLSFLIIVFTGCSTYQTTAKNKQPEWTTNLPSDKNYYQGVGYALKEKKSILHYETARKNALKNLAEEISVEISSSTIHISYENDFSLKEDFSSIIEARVNSSIEGYELVDSYENKKEYWVFYRLNKQKYAALQAQKKEQAIQLATSYYSEAEQAQQHSDIRNAVIYYSKSLDALKAYFNETIIANIDGKEVNIISEAYNRIYNILSNIEIIAENATINCKTGYRIDPKLLTCEIAYQGKSIKNFPIIASYSENALQQKLNSDANGFVQISPLVKSNKNTETIDFSIDKTTLLLQSATDFTIRKLLQKIPTRATTVYLQIAKPAIVIKSDEKNIGIATKDMVLKTKLEQLLQSKGYEIVSTNGDFEITITSDTKAASQSNGIFTASLKSRFTIKNLHNSKIVDVLDLTATGTQLSYKKAGEKAYETASQQLSSRLISSFTNAFLKTE